jgi:hypothetical protein
MGSRVVHPPRFSATRWHEAAETGYSRPRHSVQARSVCVDTVRATVRTIAEVARDPEITGGAMRAWLPEESLARRS